MGQAYTCPVDGERRNPRRTCRREPCESMPSTGEDRKRRDEALSGQVLV